MSVASEAQAEIRKAQAEARRLHRQSQDDYERATEYVTLRAAVLERDAHVCRWCGSTTAAGLRYIEPGRPFKAEHLAAVCLPCTIVAPAPPGWSPPPKKHDRRKRP